MTYGLVVKNTSLKTQIDSREEMFGMAIRSSGQASSVSNINFATDVVAIRMKNLASPRNAFIVASWSADRSKVTFHDGDFREFGLMPERSVQYINMTQAKDIGFDYSGTKYGLQTKTPSGSQRNCVL